LPEEEASEEAKIEIKNARKEIVKGSKINLKTSLKNVNAKLVLTCFKSYSKTILFEVNYAAS
jgi:hypothetical protein